MKPIELKKWMKDYDKTVIDVSSLAKLNPNTVRSFLRGGKSHPGTRLALQRMIAEYL